MMRKKRTKKGEESGRKEINLEEIPTETCPLVQMWRDVMRGDDVDSCVAMFLNFIGHMSKSEVDSLTKSVDQICCVKGDGEEF